MVPGWVSCKTRKMAGRLVRGAAAAWSHHLVHASHSSSRWAHGDDAATRRGRQVDRGQRQEELKRAPEGTGIARTWWARAPLVAAAIPSTPPPARCLCSGSGRRGLAQGRRREGAARWRQAGGVLGLRRLFSMNSVCTHVNDVAVSGRPYTWNVMPKTGLFYLYTRTLLPARPSICIEYYAYTFYYNYREHILLLYREQILLPSVRVLCMYVTHFTECESDPVDTEHILYIYMYTCITCM